MTRRDLSRVLRSAGALGIGFALAVAGALVLSLLVRWGGLEPTGYALGIRPVSNLINTPNWFSFIVAALAGVVGVVSLTEARSSTLIGVFISVTTIPAASDMRVSGVRQRERGMGVHSPTHSQRHRPRRRGDRRTSGPTSPLAENRTASSGRSTAQLAAVRASPPSSRARDDAAVVGALLRIVAG